MDIQNSNVYVGTYGKYNNGDISGKWISPYDHVDYESFIEECKQTHADEEDPELMFQDYENIPEELISESGVSEKLWEYIDLIGCHEEEAFWDFVSLRSVDIANEDSHDVYEQFQDAYQGQYKSQVDFAEHIVEECYTLEGPLKDYFDYEKFARDLFYDYDISDNGHVFRC